MPIAIDDRTGSKELAPLFVPYGIQPDVRRLDFGDLAFEGNGPAGRCAIVVERKCIADLIASIQSRRLSGHQLPGMAEDYDYCYLIVEGIWRQGDAGQIQLGSGNMAGERSWGGHWHSTHGKNILYRAVDNYLSTLELHAGIIYRRTADPLETVAVVMDLYHWWNDKQWEEHSSHLGVYAPADPATGRGRRLNFNRRTISLAEKWAIQLDGIDTRAQAAAKHFASAQELANATEADWLRVPGIGKILARRAVRLIRERTGGFDAAETET